MSRCEELNPGHPLYKSGALPTELHRRVFYIIHYSIPSSVLMRCFISLIFFWYSEIILRYLDASLFSPFLLSLSISVFKSPFSIFWASSRLFFFKKLEAWI